MRLLDTLRRLPQPVTAARLAAETEISTRQLYRDIATLRAGGVLVDGTAGYGYTLTEDPTLPPQSFSRLEIEALMLGVASLGDLGDAALTIAGRNALARIVATLPDRQARQAAHATMRSWRPTEPRAPITIALDLLRQACWDEFSVRITYRDAHDRRSEREILPLGMSYSPRTLMLVAWCLLRQGYRTFEVARIDTLMRGTTSFRPRRVQLLRDYVALRAAEWKIKDQQAALPMP
ncbi:helix-turn-helix transcriptional regulator [Sphingomonas pseudosanguinis]|uniref:Putative DNA-binding transcriptional regulator YafY n=1 Tax=Sphingomonas pseudosanguinis TaxID=413712 RepID=A0A7W6AD45_9SPHN|nr:YafY family protein [Sphingomonas pseudosanguinis]MBB3879758.1 putative DNA-binding transcriptional regulator YafY [Sphingomonas pseudosanguinis]MBN3536952.1 YafY family transcriptional regulator [Sphingomonas pseudosanguinis]